ncbi:hypothetical protein [Paenibacillus cisolokensis]|uniref:hypothetical protein n=1 Tax=Paenibacillus cisolokensis TaxID=1658519 RepID=UPI003D272396
MILRTPFPYGWKSRLNARICSGFSIKRRTCFHQSFDERGNEKLFLQFSIEFLLGFVGLSIITKMLGKNQFRQVTPFDFISAIF